MVIDLNEKFEPVDVLERKMFLHGAKTNTSFQHRLTVPKDFVEVLGWKVGEELVMSLDLTTGSLTVNKVSHLD